MIAAVEAKKQADENGVSVSKALTAMSSLGGEQSFTVVNITLKGKKVSVPGKKGKHTIPVECTLTVGTMGLKLLDGDCKCLGFRPLYHHRCLADIRLDVLQWLWQVTCCRA